MTEMKVNTGEMQLVVHTLSDYEMDDERLYEFCRINAGLRIERTPGGELEIMAPTGGETGNRNSNLNYQLTGWTLADGTGVGFDSSTGFALPNGAVRSPDASWVGRERLSELTPEQKQRFLPLCPDFVVEISSPSDSLAALEAKMYEYIENGAKLGWLIVPTERKVHVYQPNQDVKTLESPQSISGDPVLPGFVLDLGRIWKPDI